MKFNRVSTRRQPVKKNLAARLFKKGKIKKYRVASASSMPTDTSSDESSFSRSLTIILAIHVVVIGMIFIHIHYLSKHTEDPALATNSSQASLISRSKLPVLSDGTQPYMAKSGDTFTALAESFKIDEADLRSENKDTQELRPGVILRIPQQKKNTVTKKKVAPIVSVPVAKPASDDGLVSVLPTPSKPVSAPPVEDPPVAVTLRTHKVKSGETIWRIARIYKVSQKELLSLNNIKDASKIRIGQILNVPSE